MKSFSLVCLLATTALSVQINGDTADYIHPWSGEDEDGSDGYIYRDDIEIEPTESDLTSGKLIPVTSIDK